jgi:hypothetical protein
MSYRPHVRHTIRAKGVLELGFSIVDCFLIVKVTAGFFFVGIMLVVVLGQVYAQCTNAYFAVPLTA